MKKFVSLLLCFFFPLFSQPGGKAGIAVLKTPLTAWQTGLGEQLSIGKDATWTNPALMANSSDLSFQVNHEKWIEGVNSNFMGIQIPVSNWMLSAQYFISQVEDLEVRTAPTEEPLSYTDAHFLFAKVSVGYNWSKQLAFGTSVKLISEKIYSSWNQGYAIDLAGLYRLSSIPAQMTLMIQNIGSTQKLQKDETILPTSVVLGAKYEIYRAGEILKFDLSSEVRKANSSNTKISFGAEISSYDIFYIQSGYIINDENKNLTMGLQVAWDQLRFGIAWLPIANGFADKTSFSFRIDF